MANGKGATWSTAGVETWRRRMSRLRQQALEQPVVFVVGSGLSFERSTKKGVADVETLVGWIRDEFCVEVREGPPSQLYQEAIQRLGEEAGAGGGSFAGRCSLRTAVRRIRWSWCEPPRGRPAVRRKTLATSSS